MLSIWIMEKNKRSCFFHMLVLTDIQLNTYFSQEQEHGGEQLDFYRPLTLRMCMLSQRGFVYRHYVYQTYSKLFNENRKYLQACLGKVASVFSYTQMSLT